MRFRRHHIINSLIKRYNYTSYLEIGSGDGSTFNKIEATYKESVDIDSASTYHMSSDRFFSILPENKRYDIIFIDGSHSSLVASRDIENSLNHLNANGTIIMHDINPPNVECAKRHPKENLATWYGTVWKSFAKLRILRKDLLTWTVNADCGCGIIRFGKNKNLFKTERTTDRELDYNFLEKNREKLLNLISVEKFLQLLANDFKDH